MILYSDLLIPLGIEEGEEEEISYVTPAAKDQTSFLEALYIAVELSSVVHKGKVSWMEDVAVIREYGQQCVQKAGGERYEFWCGFLGC